MDRIRIFIDKWVLTHYIYIKKNHVFTFITTVPILYIIITCVYLKRYDFVGKRLVKNRF